MSNNSPTLASVIEDVMNPLGQKWTTNEATRSKRFKYVMYQRLMTELALNRYRWSGVPDEIDRTFIERILLFRSLCIFTEDPDLGYIALPGTPANMVDLYGNPQAYTLMAINGRYVKTLSNRDCVPIYPNTLRTSDMDVVSLYAMLFAEIAQTLDINTIQLRNPIVFTGPASMRKTMQTIQDQLTDGAFSFLENSAANEMIQVSAFQSELHPDNLINTQMFKQKLWNECMTYLGINNANQDKPERLVADEVSANDAQVIAARLSSIQARNNAADTINERYGLNMHCEWNSDIDAMSDMLMTNEIDGEGDDGTPDKASEGRVSQPGK